MVRNRSLHFFGAKIGVLGRRRQPDEENAYRLDLPSFQHTSIIDNSLASEVTNEEQLNSSRRDKLKTKKRRYCLLDYYHAICRLTGSRCMRSCLFGAVELGTNDDGKDFC